MFPGMFRPWVSVIHLAQYWHKSALGRVGMICRAALAVVSVLRDWTDICITLGQ
jgi:hypothetical protein